MIKGSGARREFNTGAVRDIQEGKGKMDLLPWAAIMEVSKHCEAGAKKYGEHNVDKGIPTHSLIDSAMRHLAKYVDGWDDEPHLLAAAWNVLWAVQMEIKHPELCDIPWRDADNTTNDGNSDDGSKPCADEDNTTNDNTRRALWESVVKMHGEDPLSGLFPETEKSLDRLTVWGKADDSKA